MMDLRYAPITPQDRERAAGLLRAGFAAGRIDSAEFDGRMAFLFGGTRTYDELWSAIRDQPDAASIMPAIAPAAPPPPAEWPPRYTMPPRERDGLAIASLVCSLAGVFTLGVGSVLGIVFGHVVQARLRRRRQPADSFAAAGVAIGYMVVGIVLSVLVVWVVMLGDLAAHFG